MQQVGGALGLAILVTVFGAASRRAGADPSLKSTSAAAKHAYVVGVDRAFTVATGFLFIVLLLVSFAIGDMPKHERPSAEEELTETLEAAGAFSATASG
jgi:hypothetical protein